MNMKSIKYENLFAYQIWCGIDNNFTISEIVVSKEEFIFRK